MKLFQFAIASIIDANTGSGLVHGAGHFDYAAAERRSLKIRSRSYSVWLQRIGAAISAAGIAMSKRRKLRQNLRQLDHLGDRLLEDIGLTRGDIMAARNGELDLDGLLKQRIENRGNKRIGLRGETVLAPNRISGHALNEALYAKAKCA